MLGAGEQHEAHDHDDARDRDERPALAEHLSERMPPSGLEIIIAAIEARFAMRIVGMAPTVEAELLDEVERGRKVAMPA